jgi:hypothetical protein
MSFDEISHVVPWLELAADQGQDLNAPQYGDQLGSPRFFKTHAWERDCPKFPKTIVVIRKPEDVLVSFFEFFEDWFFVPGTIELNVFAREFWLARGVPLSKMQNASYFVHLISWYQRRHDPDVLFVCFEDLLDDLEGQVRRIARFVSNDKVGAVGGGWNVFCVCVSCIVQHLMFSKLFPRFSQSFNTTTLRSYRLL